VGRLISVEFDTRSKRGQKNVVGETANRRGTLPELLAKARKNLTLWAGKRKGELGRK